MSDTVLTCAPAHGCCHLPALDIVHYAVEVQDHSGFIGDRANKHAFRALIDARRRRLRAAGGDPFGDSPTSALTRRRLDTLLAAGDPGVAEFLDGVIDDFATDVARVLRCFIRLDGWTKLRRIVIGGGFAGSQACRMMIPRVAGMLRAERSDVEITAIRNDPNTAGLIGAVHLAPAALLDDRDAVLAADIGGTNIRAGVVQLDRNDAADLSKAHVGRFELWRHGDESLNRDEAVNGLILMLRRLISRAASDGVHLAPFIGLGCAGTIKADGTIARGAHNLPGNWEGGAFNLPAQVTAAIPRIAGAETTIVMHNDAVVQGLSEAPHMQDVPTWAIFTIGTGLGNALFANRRRGYAAR
jgi:hypothetical protein